MNLSRCVWMLLKTSKKAVWGAGQALGHPHAHVLSCRLAVRIGPSCLCWELGHQTLTNTHSWMCICKLNLYPKSKTTGYCVHCQEKLKNRNGASQLTITRRAHRKGLGKTKAKITSTDGGICSIFLSKSTTLTPPHHRCCSLQAEPALTCCFLSGLPASLHHTKMSCCYGYPCYSMCCSPCYRTTRYYRTYDCCSPCNYSSCNYSSCNYNCDDCCSYRTTYYHPSCCNYGYRCCYPCC